MSQSATAANTHKTCSQPPNSAEELALLITEGHNTYTTASLLDELVVHDKDDGRQQQQYDGPSNELIGGDTARHVGQNAARFGNVVIGSMKCVARMADRLPLPMKILQDADSQLLCAALSHNLGTLVEEAYMSGQAPDIMDRTQVLMALGAYGSKHVDMFHSYRYATGAHCPHPHPKDE